MREAIAEINKGLEDDIRAVGTVQDLDELKVKYLRKKGPVQGLVRALRDISPEERPNAGKLINDFKGSVEDRLCQLQESFEGEESSRRLEEETLDITLPGRRRFLSRKHLVTQMLDEVLDILSGMGFTVQYGPDIETDYYNFEALNFAKDHPARDMQDTFYIDKDTLLRTHTSNTQVRVMESNTPPIRVAIPGKCFRNETITARSHVFFHQVEGLYIDEGVTFADLLSMLEEFFQKLFHDQDTKVRVRPSYFPFVEPGMEVDVSCMICSGKGCPICKHTGWLEVAGAGMVHPEVMKSGGIDSEKYTGYAWGLGLERLLMIKHGIKDIRLFFENDLRFLEQFA